VKRAIPTLFLLLVAAALTVYAFRTGRRTETAAEPYPAGTVRAETIEGGARVVDSRTGVMGTRFSVEAIAPDEATGREACRAAFRRIADLEAAMSTWRPDSVLSRVNREAADHPVEVDPDTFAVLTVAREICLASDRTFDPSVGPLLRVWKPLATLSTLPSDAEVAAARALVGYDGVLLDPKGLTVRFDRAGMSLDVGGIAKGYAADAAMAAALAVGATACRVNAGGDMVAGGRDHVFEVEVRDPAGGEADALPGRGFTIETGGVATSGNYERYTEIAGKRYSHILDPRTGRPVTDAVAQVTVVAPSGILADAYATALVVLGPVEGKALAERTAGTEALFLVPEGGGYRQVATDGFPGEDR
jgi:thiamine biosynthesis lipoprotein